MCFVFRHETAYDVRITDWSSDVCSSDLIIPANGRQRRTQRPVSSQDWPPTKSFKLQPGNRYNLGGEDHENIQIVAACSVGLGAVGFDARFRLSGGRAGASDAGCCDRRSAPERRSEEHTSELQSLMRISYAVFSLKKKQINT